MSLASYSDLQTEVAAWLHDPNNTSVSVAQIQNFITLGETRLNDALRLRSMENTATLTLQSATNSVALPSGFLEPISLSYSDGYILVQASRDDIDASQHNSNVSTGRPTYYAYGSTLLDFERTADTTYTLTLRYFKRWNLATDLTNTLMTVRPGAYLYSTLVCAAQWRRDTELLSQMSNLLNSELQELMLQDGRSRGSAPMQSDAHFLNGGVYDIASDTWR